MMLVLSVLLALVRCWALLDPDLRFITTVDGLFMSLILLTMSAIVGLNVLLELRKLRAEEPSRPRPPRQRRLPAASSSGERSKAFCLRVRRRRAQQIGSDLCQWWEFVASAGA